ncbi:dihydroorotase [thiotrophic endosymbiont of Bathymodiolus puteoserpentis (Logatchev)]|uniref:dihydroorotase n=1 Tax=thiotrophic endosymbiont of Bathymodiolus puteoserpentis (Logatchev) TaxID=343240 RepID=UPI0010B50223|nr:dihydroorotase [thiotrophic endosymbiont of Bathymodiolus puteoserpentis (Logatchev)]CAC9588231.1 Dihydroorotase (EC 3.5.2.3) [uncultured Gammaproteobacteria bacterium]SSC10827.1 Dihydroorotase [thiotrophic endosymbiont of Bathymodiolus puteoserpentis (Logatchev)]
MIFEQMKQQQITLIKPDDWHLHVRNGEALKSVIGMSAKQMGRAIIMPNLSPPVTDANGANAYQEEILNALPKDSVFKPLMVLYLTDNTTSKVITQAYNAGVVAAKLYPAGATTNSDSGVSNIKNIYRSLETMQKLGMLLLVHGEVTRSEVDIFDREAVFIDEVLSQTVNDFPKLKIVFEHITTKNAVDFVRESGDRIAATITPQHLLNNRNDMLVGGIKPHTYCLPVLKRAEHQRALVEVATSGNPKFFLGTDSAPHAKTDKESSCGCAGVFSAPHAIELYAQAFDQAGAIDKLEGFASKFGADFYGLAYNTSTITLKKQDWIVPASYPFISGDIVPFMAEKMLNWKVV